jgi:2',3'-cyclic-nucleotide 2'-phosphodiesterase (5'-nucleotidase family)
MAKEFHGVDADVSIYNTGGIRSSIPAGDVTLGDIYAVYPFDNVLSLVTMKGSDLRSLFEYVANNGGMPINAGVRLVISNRKVKSVTIDGKEIDDSKTYTVATIDYLVNLGKYGLENAITRNDAPEIIRDYFGEYFRHLVSEDPENMIRYQTDGRIRVE